MHRPLSHPRVPLAAWSGAFSARRAACLGVLAAGLGLLITGCHQSPPATGATRQPVLAEVGSRSIDAADLVAEATRRAESRRPVPGREELLQEMIERTALLERARQAGLDRDPSYQREIESLLIRRLQARELDPRRESLTVTDTEVRAEYDANPGRYSRPAQNRLAMLFLAVDRRASDARRNEVRTRLQEGRRRFQAIASSPQPPAGPGFGALAVDYSDDQVTRHRGGDLGWIETGKAPSRIPAEIIEAGCALPEGQVSEVLEAGGGFYLLLRTDTRGPSVTPFEAVEASLRQSLLVRKRNELDEQFRAETARLFPARVHTQALVAVNLPVAATALAVRDREPQPPAAPGMKDTSHAN